MSSCAWRRAATTLRMRSTTSALTLTSCGALAAAAEEEERDESRMEMGGDDIGEDQQDKCNDYGEDGGNVRNAMASI